MRTEETTGLEARQWGEVWLWNSWSVVTTEISNRHTKGSAFRSISYLILGPQGKQHHGVAYLRTCMALVVEVCEQTSFCKDRAQTGRHRQLVGNVYVVMMGPFLRLHVEIAASRIRIENIFELVTLCSHWCLQLLATHASCYP